MNSTRGWRLRLGLGLAALSAVLFYVHYLVFRDAHHLGIFTLHDIAFLPLEVLIVTLIIHALLETRERQELMQKLNMVIDAFFSEVGTELIERLASFDAEPDRLLREFKVDIEWTDDRLKKVSAIAEKTSYALRPTRSDALELKTFMLQKRDFLLRLLENQTLLENERFTDTLWAVFHLGDELQRRKDIMAVSDADLAHLVGDMERAYGRLIAEWFEHLRHLKRRYPYLYSLSVRANPLDFESEVEITD